MQSVLNSFYPFITRRGAILVTLRQHDYLFSQHNNLKRVLFPIVIANFLYDCTRHIINQEPQLAVSGQFGRRQSVRSERNIQFLIIVSVQCPTWNITKESCHRRIICSGWYRQTVITVLQIINSIVCWNCYTT